MLSYFDAEGSPITKSEWRRLFRIPGYGDPMIHRSPGLEVRLSWVGVVSDREPRPGIWLVEAIEMDGDGKARQQRSAAWLPTRSRAEAEYVLTIPNGLGAPEEGEGANGVAG